MLLLISNFSIIIIKCGAMVSVTTPLPRGSSDCRNELFVFSALGLYTFTCKHFIILPAKLLPYLALRTQMSSFFTGHVSCVFNWTYKEY